MYSITGQALLVNHYWSSITGQPLLVNPYKSTTTITRTWEAHLLLMDRFWESHLFLMDRFQVAHLFLLDGSFRGVIDAGDTLLRFVGC